MPDSSKPQRDRLLGWVESVTMPPGYTPGDHSHHDSFTSVRKAVYRGKRIVVETTYRITIDDVPVRVHTAVLDDGTVHYHGFPNYSFPSALDLGRRLVDASFVELPPDEIGGDAPDDDDGHHGGGHH